ncbi:MAG: hypothetical protein ACKV0T_14160 [Planctomycetales bacterium]
MRQLQSNPNRSFGIAFAILDIALSFAAALGGIVLFMMPEKMSDFMDVVMLAAFFGGAGALVVAFAAVFMPQSRSIVLLIGCVVILLLAASYAYHTREAWGSV